MQSTPATANSSNIQCSQLQNSQLQQHTMQPTFHQIHAANTPDTPNSSTVLSETPTTKQNVNSKKEKDFQWMVLYKLNKIMKTQQKIEERLTALETACTNADMQNGSINDEINGLFPLRIEADVEKLERLLKDKDEMANVVNVLKSIGGYEERDVLFKIMKKLFTCDLAEKYSWNGTSQKRPFKNLLLCNAVLRSVRFHFPNITEERMFNFISRYLKYSKQRRERQALKSIVHNEDLILQKQ